MPRVMKWPRVCRKCPAIVQNSPRVRGRLGGLGTHPAALAYNAPFCVAHMPLPTPTSLTLWRLIDGKPGHEKQSLGLAQALKRLAAARWYDIPVQGKGLAAVRAALRWGLKRFPAGCGLPAPDLILAAGHAAHLPALAARRTYGGRIVVLMRPSLPSGLFDLCLIPLHDRPAKRPNIIATQGVLNAVSVAGVHDPQKGLILLGGPSPHYHWDDAAIAAQVREVVAVRQDMTWTLTTSRRTPTSLLAALGEVPGLLVYPHTQTPAGWLESHLAESAEVWVSPDSGSMVYEALTAGCRVGLFELAPSAGSRIVSDIAHLIEAGWVTSIARWRRERTLAPAPVGFNEAERCARLILARWYA